MVNGAFSGEGVMLPLKPDEFALVPYAKEARVAVTKTTSTTTLPPHRTIYLDLDDKETVASKAVTVWGAYYRETETRYEVDNRSDRAYPQFLIDHVLTAKDAVITQGGEWVDGRFVSSVKRRLCVSIPAHSTLTVVVKERREFKQRPTRWQLCGAYLSCC